jgi:hypothetical protein
VQRTAPCRTFAGAISKTAVGGEINCLDPGGFGSVTITQAITIDCHEVFASILAPKTTGIAIKADAAVVTLRNINIDGNGSGLKGVDILAASRVNIEDCMIMAFTEQGINDTRPGNGNSLVIKNTTIRNNAAPGIVAGAGETSGTVLENVHSVGNTFGLAAAKGNNVVISRSVMSWNKTAGIEVDSGATLFVDNTVISHNGDGVEATGTVYLGNSDITFNATGINGATTSFGNNRIVANNSAGTVPSLGAASSDHAQE